MYSRACLLALSLLAPTSWQPQDPPDLPVTLPSWATPAGPVLEQAAGRMEGFDLGAVLYDRLPMTYASRDSEEQLRAAWRPVFETPFLREELLKLLGHDNPRVRTLAAARLFHENEPRLLPQLLPLLEDDAETIPRILLMVGRLASEKAPARPVTQTQTVAEVVGSLLGFYSKRLGLRHSSVAEYWVHRADREHCLSWFDTRLLRITHGESPLRFDRLKLHCLRDEIDALSPADRDWSTIAIFHGSRDLLTSVVTSDRQLAAQLWLVRDCDVLFAARRRGRAALLEVLRGEAPSDDPDWPTYLERVQSYILEHAEELLEPADGEELLSLAADATARATAPWCVAAARLAPAEAHGILSAGLVRIQGERYTESEQLMLARELWVLVGEPAEEQLVEWFFGNTAELTAPPSRSELIELLAERWRAPDRALLARLLGDRRSDALDPRTVGALARALNQNLSEPVFDRNEIRESYGGSIGGKEDLRAEWLERMRATMSGWAG